MGRGDNSFFIKHQTPLAVALMAALAAAFCAPILKHPANWAIGDWDQFLFYAESARKSIVQYKQFPLWSPYFCGGNILLANPQSQFMSPSFLLVIFFGPLLGMRLKVILFAFIGLLGGYALGRSMKFPPVSSVLCAVVFQLSGVFPAYAANGQQWILSAAFIPWALLCFRFSFEKHRRWRLPAAVFLAAAWFEGGIYPFPFAFLLLGLYAVIFTTRGRRLDPVISLVLTAALVLMLGAVKFLPFFDAISGSRRALPLEPEDVVTAATMLRMFFSSALHPSAGHYPYFEYYAYLGAVPAALAAASLLKPRETARWWLLLLIFAFLALGVHSPLPLWHALHSAPFFNSMHVTSRFRMLMLVPLSILAAHTLALLETRSASNKSLLIRITPAALLAAAAISLFAANSKVLGTGFVLTPKPFVSDGQFRQHWELPLYGSSWAMYPAALAGVGTVTCYEYFTTDSIPFSGRLKKFGMATAVEAPKYRGEAFMESGRGDVKTTRWSPGEIEVSARAESADALVINQNFDRGWRAESGGAELAVSPSDGGLIAVKLPPGVNRVRLRYMPRAFAPGLAMSAAACAVFIVLMVVSHKQRGGGRNSLES